AGAPACDEQGAERQAGEAGRKHHEPGEQCGAHRPARDWAPESAAHSADEDDCPFRDPGGSVAHRHVPQADRENGTPQHARV
ncbi:unnamed protein product, partial [Ectocarpus sp. 8 AP-2014]